jgi:hypothetical protein
MHVSPEQSQFAVLENSRFASSAIFFGVKTMSWPFRQIMITTTEALLLAPPAIDLEAQRSPKKLMPLPNPAKLIRYSPYWNAQQCDCNQQCPQV